MLTNLLALGASLLIVCGAGVLAVVLECWHGPGGPPCDV